MSRVCTRTMRVDYPVNGARFANILGFLCVRHCNWYHHTATSNIAPLFPLIFSRLPRPSRRRRGYLETVRDLPGSSAGNQRKRRLRVRPLCTHASVSSRTPLAHLSPDNYRISARNSPAGRHAWRKARRSRSVTGQDNDGSRGVKTYHLYLPSTNHPSDHHFCESHYLKVLSYSLIIDDSFGKWMYCII